MSASPSVVECSFTRLAERASVTAWVCLLACCVCLLFPGLTSAQEAEATKEKKGADDPITFTAKDSLLFYLKGRREATLFGTAKVKHEKASLSSGVISIDLKKNVMSAQAINPRDTLSQPVLEQGEERIRSRKVSFNYKTERGKFEVARISMDDGNLIGTEVKNKSPEVIFIKDAKYSTCELDHPHFYIKTDKMKVVDQKEVFFTNARLYFWDIPYPFVFPVGYFPSDMESKKSGPLTPTYAFQQPETRGLGLQNLGWFQYFNDYIVGTTSFDVFTSGTFYNRSEVNYRKVDAYGGRIGIGYSRDQGLESSDVDFARSTQRSIQISHNQRLNPYSNLDVSIDYRTADYYRNNSVDINQRADINAGSRIGYSYNHPDGVYNLNANVRQNQNFLNNSTNITGPDINFSLRPFRPFQAQQGGATRKWYESVNVSYRSSMRSRYDFRPLVDAPSNISWLDALLSPSKHRTATGSLRPYDFGITHNGSVNAQLASTGFYNITSSVSYDEFWYPGTIEKEFNVQENRIVNKYVPGFATARQFTSSINANTRLYGFWNQRIGNLQGFRHTMSPQIGFSYRPDFSTEAWGFYRTVDADALGERTQKYSRFEGSLIGGPGAGEVRAINFRLENTFETKQVKRDSTGEKSERVIKLIDDISANLSYNFVAPQYKLSDLQTRMLISILNALSITSSATFTFYDTNEQGARIPKYLWDNGKGYARLTNINVATGTDFNGGNAGGGGMRASPTTFFPEEYDPFDQEYFRHIDRRFYAMPVEDFSTPWNVSVNFNYNWSRFGNTVNQSAVINASNISIRPTREWSLATSLGYDFISKELTPSQFRVARRLHCWDMSFQWSPFGQFTYYLFRLSVNSAQFQGIFQKLPGMNSLEQSSTPVFRGGGRGF